jgi:hypothetical protein
VTSIGAALHDAGGHLVAGRTVVDALLRTWYRGRPPAPIPIARRRRPSLGEFAAIRRAGRPVVLEGMLEEWPDPSALTIERLCERFGERELPVMRTEKGQLAIDVAKGVAFETMRLRDYVDRVVSGVRMDVYLATPLDVWLPELRRDVPVPSYCRDAPWTNPRLWLGASGTVTPLHRDVAQNFFYQLVGRKRFWLYPPSASPWLYSQPIRSALANYARFDPERPDDARFPLSRMVEPVEVVLGPGDAMFLPSRWWHHVRSLDVGLSVAFWWADGPVALAVKAAELTKRARGLEIYGLHRRSVAR